ncbi:MAG: hypothetical protein KBF64_05450 [Anaerolineaceae bacterium]|nr:hypothetical protein [Anaerolineaceae bacterium]
MILFGGIFIAALRPAGDPDLWWHLQTGKQIIETGTIPHADLFSSTMIGKEWITHEWLTESILYLIYDRLGMIPLIALFSAVITGAFYFAFLRAGESSRPYTAGFVVFVGAVASAPLWGIRPQMISLLLTSIFLFLLDNYEKDRKVKSLIALPLIMILWVNMHGGFIIGIGIIGIYLAGNLLTTLARIKQDGIPKKDSWYSILSLFGTVILCTLAALINPNSYKILIYPFQTITDPAMQQLIVEWFSPDFHQLIWLPFGVLVLALIGFGLAGKTSVSLTRILLVVVATFAAFRSVRHIPLFAIASVPILADLIAPFFQLSVGKETGKPIFRWLNAVLILAVFIGAGVVLSRLPQEQSKKESETFPVGAVTWLLENHPDGKLFNSYTWGGYLIWKLYPDYPVYIDGRADVYGANFFSHFASIYSAEDGWEQALDDTGASLILVERDCRLASELRKSTQWPVVYQDDLSVIFQKEN